MAVSRGLLDTSVLIGHERRRALATDRLPERSRVSVVTFAELRAGVLSAASDAERIPRLATLERAVALEPLPIDGAVAESWAALRTTLRRVGRRMPVNDSWIAATALAHGLPIVTQDDDYDGVPGLAVIRV
jgi:predicted nucleic acid-binding protein